MRTLSSASTSAPSASSNAVEHREELLDQAFRGPLEVLRLAPERLLLEVLEVRLDLLGERAHLIALVAQAGQVGLEHRAGFSRRVVTELLGAGRVGLHHRVVVVAGS